MFFYFHTLRGWIVEHVEFSERVAKEQEILSKHEFLESFYNDTKLLHKFTQKTCYFRSECAIIKNELLHLMVQVCETWLVV